jgi:hypothetical protein
MRVDVQRRGHTGLTHGAVVEGQAPMPVVRGCDRTTPIVSLGPAPIARLPRVLGSVRQAQGGKSELVVHGPIPRGRTSGWQAFPSFPPRLPQFEDARESLGHKNPMLGHLV